MRHRVRFLTLLASLATCAIAGQAGAQAVTFGVDGRMWRSLDTGPIPAEVGKLLVLRGVLDGLMFGRSPLIEHDSLYLDASLDQLTRALDEFYSDSRNDQVFVVWALQIVSLEMRGVPAGTVQAKLADMRRRATEARRVAP